MDRESNVFLTFSTHVFPLIHSLTCTQALSVSHTYSHTHSHRAGFSLSLDADEVPTHVDQPITTSVDLPSADILSMLTSPHTNTCCIAVVIPPHRVD